MQQLQSNFISVVFVCGKFLYKINFPEKNVIVESFQCIVVRDCFLLNLIKNKTLYINVYCVVTIFISQYAVKNRKSQAKESHWLQAASAKYDQQFITDLQVYPKIIYPYRREGTRLSSLIEPMYSM